MVLANADLPYVYRELLDEPYPSIDRLAFSCSAFLMYLGVGRRYPRSAASHPGGPRRSPDHLRRHLQPPPIPADPAYYICNPSKTDPVAGPCPAARTSTCWSRYPASRRDTRSTGQSRVPASRPVMLERLERFGLTDLRRHIVTRRIFTPADFGSCSPRRAARRSGWRTGSIRWAISGPTIATRLPQPVLRGTEHASGVRRPDGADLLAARRRADRGGTGGAAMIPRVRSAWRSATRAPRR